MKRSYSIFKNNPSFSQEFSGKVILDKFLCGLEKNALLNQILVLSQNPNWLEIVLIKRKMSQKKTRSNSKIV